MKKTFIAFVIIAASIVTASCQKENALASGGQSSSSSPVFTASIDNEIGTKTVLTSERKINWESTDKISINGAVYAATPDGSDPTKATFTKESGSDPTGVFYAYYPSTIYDGTKCTLPSVQVYDAGKLNAPMYSISTNTSLSFSNICGILAITVKSTEISLVKKIRISSTNCALSGDFIISANPSNLYLSHPDAVENTVILDCGEGVVPTASGTVFYIAVPPQTYKDLAIEISPDGIVYTKGMRTIDGLDIFVDKNTLYPILFDGENCYVEGTYSGLGIRIAGTTWAPVNCGYEPYVDATHKGYPYGKMYQWGRKDGQGLSSIDASTPTLVNGRISDLSTLDANSFYYGYSNWYNGSSPAPNDLWKTDGSTEYNPCPAGWRVPTIDELGSLYYVDWNPSSKSGSVKRGRFVFNTLPYYERIGGLCWICAGRRESNGSINSDHFSHVAYYWSSTMGTSNPYRIGFDENGPGFYEFNRSYGLSVRCVMITE